MSLLISDAAGSKEVADAVEKRPGHPEVIRLKMGDMPYGDCMMTLQGPANKPILLGIEIKKLDDLLNCISSGRFSGHQAIGMADIYDVSILLLEGQWRMNTESGVLETLKYYKGKYQWAPVSTGKRQWMYRELNRWLLVESVVAGIQVWRTLNMDETVQTLLDLYALGQKKWREHQTVHDHNRVSVDQLKYREMPDGTRRLRYEKPSLCERIAIQFEGLGHDRAIAVGKHFKSAEELGKHWLDEKAWREVPDARIGKGISKNIVEEIKGEK